MNGKTRRAAALTLLCATTAICVASVPGLVDTWDVRNEGAWGFRGFGLPAAMVFALAGALLAFKRPENPVGWLFGAIGAAFGLMTAGETYAVIPLIEGNDGGIRYQVAWLTSWGWVAFLGLIAFSILLFPSGHLALAYLAIVVLLQTLLAPITQDSDLAVAGSTLGVAALFRPLRDRVQRFIDQRFYRSRYDAVATVSAFSPHLRDGVDLGSLTQQLVEVVESTMQPAHASRWLKVGDHPPDGDGVAR